MAHKSVSLNANGIIRKLYRLGGNISLLAQDFSIIPKNDPKQALRLGRFFISLGIYVLNLSLAYLAYYVGVMELKAFYGNWIMILTVNIILYIVFRTGWNKKMQDPSLTSVQICIASLVVMYSIFFVYQAKGILLSVYILILLFGIFRLNTRQFLHVSAFILITYGIDIFLLKRFHPQDINIQGEFFQWMALAVILISVSFIGGNISALRRELSNSRKKLQESFAKIQEMAIQDDLTGFYNRRHLMELIENEHRRAERTGAVFSVAMMDLDKFKNVNDTLGHQAGDAVLMTFANIIRNVLRKTDFCGRYGGEEFLIVLTQTHLKEAKIFAERIRACVEECLVFDTGARQKSHVTVSIGLAENLKNEGIYRTISRADEAVYKAKKNGRNRVEVCE